MKSLSEKADRKIEEQTERFVQAHRELVRRGLKLTLFRGIPSPEQLSLSQEMLSSPGLNFTSMDGLDARNYGDLQGLRETRELFAPMLGTKPDQVVVGGNSSLSIMHDTIVHALLKGVPGGSQPWTREPQIQFLCPVPGYDRHFKICEDLGIKMINVPLTGEGPDPEIVEELVKDPSVKGMWCVPRFSNPSGETYSSSVVERLSSLRTGAADFRLFWDNAYAVHEMSDKPSELANILERCEKAGHPDRPFVFSSTSKITFAGAGFGLFASSKNNVQWFLKQTSRQTIGPDKLNQLRHVRFLKDMDGIRRHMQKHRSIIEPKFRLIEQIFAKQLEPWKVARWNHPEGGYFVSLNALPGTAKRVVQLAAEAGIQLVPAGATYPYGLDPEDSNVRIAPTFPSLDEIKEAAEGIAICVLLAASEKRGTERS
jgi:DNA-binding transcriptional MocR family regulator